jgi:hypothetical protein
MSVKGKSAPTPPDAALRRRLAPAQIGIGGGGNRPGPARIEAQALGGLADIFVARAVETRPMRASDEKARSYLQAYRTRHALADHVLWWILCQNVPIA